MTITELKNKFEFYATNHTDLNHVATDRRKRTFFHTDIEEIQQALTEGIKLPALLLQTPEVEKASAFDNMSEVYAFTFVVLLAKSENKILAMDKAKAISDSILNRLMSDISLGEFPGIISGTDEGKFGPMGDGLIGWGVSISIVDGYNAEVNHDNWRDLA